MDLYREEILEHWQNPSNWGGMKDAHLVVHQVNPLCGDKVTFYFRFLTSGNAYSRSEHGDRIISDVSFTGNGCAISIASASILSENIKNKTLNDVRSLEGDDVLKMIGSSKDNFPPARLKCVFLGLEALRRIRLTQRRQAQGKL